jgi:hypothetical protein
MAGLEALDTSLTQDIEDMQIQEFKIIQTSKKKDSILYDGFYFNHMRDNKNSTVFKCRHIIEVDGKKKNVPGTLLYKVIARRSKHHFPGVKILGCHFHFTS